MDTMGGIAFLQGYVWEFPKLRGPFLGSPHNKDHSILGCVLGALIFGSSHMEYTGNPKLGPT